MASLPIFLENVYGTQPDCVTVYGTEAVLTALREDLFNDRIWPDFVRLSTAESPFLKLQRLEPGQTVECDGLRVTPVLVNHVVPTVGFVIEDPSATVVISSDTGPTEELWEHANAAPNLRAVFLEASFPDAMAPLADISKHLTPALFAREIKKLRRPATVIAVHIKPRFRVQIMMELKALGLPNLEIGQPGRPYSFGEVAHPSSLAHTSFWPRWLQAVLSLRSTGGS